MMRTTKSETFSFSEYGFTRFEKFAAKIVRENPDADTAELEAIVSREQDDFLRRTRDYIESHPELLRG
jgi:hypothetical protein